MALVLECPKCKRSKVIDVRCGGYCYECLNEYPELGGHKPNCNIAILRAKDKARIIIRAHENIARQILKRDQANTHISMYAYLLKQIDPCPECHGHESSCNTCKGTGFNSLTDELRRIAEAPDPPKTC